MNPPSPDAHASPRSPAGPSPAPAAGERHGEHGELRGAGAQPNTPHAKLITIEPLDVDGLLSFPPERPEEAPVASSDSVLDIGSRQTGVIGGETAPTAFDAIDVPALTPTTAPRTPVPAHTARAPANRRRKGHRESHAAQTASRMIGGLRRSASEWKRALRKVRCRLMPVLGGAFRAAACRDLPRRVDGVRVRLGSISGAVRGAMLRSAERATRPLRDFRPLAAIDGPHIHRLNAGRSRWLLVFGSGFAAGALSTALVNVTFDAGLVPSQEPVQEGAAPAVPASSHAEAGFTPLASQVVTPTAPRADSTEAVARGSEPNGPSQPAPEPPRPAVTNTPVRESANDVAAVAFQGSLEIRSTPPGARVFVNGTLAGTAPIVMDSVRVGSRAVRAELAGYQSWSAAVTVVVNQRTVATAVMRPLPAP